MEAGGLDEPAGRRTGPPVRVARVVLVDDTPDLRDLLSLAFGPDDGFEVVAEAGDGREAIEVVGGHRPDVVLLDLAMPVMDGLAGAAAPAGARARRR